MLSNTLFQVIGGGILLYGLYSAKNYLAEYYKSYKKNRLVKNNIIDIVHKIDQGSAISSLLSSTDTCITIKTHMDFVKTYEKMDKDKDIHVLIHTVGGALSSAEAICNCIANHKGKGKVIAYIPYYAYSGGCAIMLACDKVFMHRNAIIGPCDAQKPVGKLSTHSIKAIIDTVEYKKDKDQKIDEEWYANSVDAESCKTRQKGFVDNLVKRGTLHEQLAEKIYDEFFSGKYNHDKIFSAQEAKELGLNVEIVDSMPAVLKDIVESIN